MWHEERARPRVRPSPHRASRWQCRLTRGSSGRSRWPPHCQRGWVLVAGPTSVGTLPIGRASPALAAFSFPPIRSPEATDLPQPADSRELRQLSTLLDLECCHSSPLWDLGTHSQSTTRYTCPFPRAGNTHVGGCRSQNPHPAAGKPVARRRAATPPTAAADSSGDRAGGCSRSQPSPRRKWPQTG